MLIPCSISKLACVCRSVCGVIARPMIFFDFSFKYLQYESTIFCRGEEACLIPMHDPLFEHQQIDLLRYSIQVVLHVDVSSGLQCLCIRYQVIDHIICFCHMDLTSIKINIRFLEGDELSDPKTGK